MATIQATTNRAQSATATQVVNAIEAEAAKRYGEAVKNHLIVTGGAKATSKPEAKTEAKAESKPEAKTAKAATTKAKAAEAPKAESKPEAKPTEAKPEPTAAPTAAEPEATEIEIVAETPEEIAQRKTKQLQTMLQRFTHLKDLNHRRTRFLETLEELEEANKTLTAEEDFTTQSYALNFVKGQYRNDTAFTIGNRELILDFIQYLTQRIRDKVQAIEEEIITA